ncbi:CDP-alcohol phosphatidyltransferase [Streptomyces sp. MS06]|uniref:CDP-alcohol phosphatidyltransferase n=1 Tax=Streptomyces sp. MS06 TaxID=3385974 RepID=UPI0039A0F92B
MPQHTRTHPSPGTTGAAEPSATAEPSAGGSDATGTDAGGPKGTGPKATVSKANGPDATAAADSGGADTGATDTGGADTGGAESSATDAAAARTVAKTGAAEAESGTARTTAETARTTAGTARTTEGTATGSDTTAPPESTTVQGATSVVESTDPSDSAAPERSPGEAPSTEDAPSPGEAASPGTGSPSAGTGGLSLRGALASLTVLRVRRVRRAWQGWREDHPATSRALSIAATVVAFAIVGAALLLPNRSEAFQFERFTRIPVELLLLAAVMVALRRRVRLVVAVLFGLALGAQTVLNLLDVGFYEYLGRNFDIVLDWPLLGDAESFVGDTRGGTVARLAVVGVLALVVVLFAVLVLSVVRIGDVLRRDPSRATRALLLVSAVWMTCASVGVKYDGVPLASQQSVAMFQARQKAVSRTLQDEEQFAKQVKADAFGATPGDQLVPDLRGKDMIFTFIESYGRSAVEDPIEAPGVDSTLDSATGDLAAAGFHAKSGWLTSATYGGGSWLGHSTFLSGLWISNQSRYRTVTTGDRLSLTKVFQKTGAWDTVGVMPGVQKVWPEQRFFGLDKVHNAFQLGYQGPKFSWSTMPDQYALEAFQRLEHGKKRDKPLMSEVILTSSHQPWGPIPKMVGWDELGDGRIFGPIEKAGNKAADIIASPERSKEEYGKSVQYSVTALTQWLERYGTDDTVLVFLGDHQPIARVSGEHANRDVPVSIVAKDPKVLDAIDDWNWTDGLRPAHDAPVWKMSAFRDRFLLAYGSTPHPSKN